MRLKQIKLAGFKSFVDPTTVTLPGNRSAVVGPNGCGKSNIIDAVRWVMGESSAKQLRGENITDVIFNGSNTRKPTAVASIELFFDNSDGRIGGEFAAYAEIAIRRQVSRDGQSQYFLNGQKCRRRDIQDIFLGTGFGPRSYSIIEQGMISQLVEAKPEELRVYLEEAAGISKYKERRRETENRIRHTRENLERINDIREELNRQLDRLQRQAQAAARYRELRDEESVLKAQLLGIRHAGVRTRLADIETQINAVALEQDKALAHQRHLESEIEAHRTAHAEGTDRFNEVQGRFYREGAEITRIEDAIQFNQSRVEQLEQDLQSVQERDTETNTQLKMDEAQIQTLRERLNELFPRVEVLAGEDQAAQARLIEAEEAMREWQAGWDLFNQASGESDRNAEVQASRIDHLQQLTVRLRRRLEELEGQLNQVTTQGPENAQISLLAEEIDSLEGEGRLLEMRIDETLKELAAAREDVLVRERVLDEARNEVLALRHELATLQAVQDAALGEHRQEADSWLDEHALSDNARLGESLAVVPGWELAIEAVLGSFVGAIQVDALDPLAASLADLPDGDLALIERRGQTTQQLVRDAVNAELELPSLHSLVRTDDVQAGSLLHGVYAAQSAEVAMARRHLLKNGESIITRAGFWVGADWVRVLHDSDEQAGILERGQTLETLSLRVEEAERSLAELQHHVVEGRNRVELLEEQRESLQRTANQLTENLGRRRTDHGVTRVKLEEAGARQAELEQARVDIAAQLEAEEQSLEQARAALQVAERQREQQSGERETLSRRRADLDESLSSVREAARQSRDEFHALNIEKENVQSRLNASTAARERLVEQGEELKAQAASIQAGIDASKLPIPNLSEELETKLAAQVEIESQLGDIRSELQGVEERTRALESSRHEAEQGVEQFRAQLEEQRVARQGLSVQESNLMEQVGATGQNLDEVMAQLPEDATEALWLESVERMERRIQRLGAINLAAIEEYETESERKTYLDAQAQDLEEALETLLVAIKKIDRETRSRFKDTFEAVNSRLGELFPKVFGGGHAYLELTGEDLLDTGVSLMARPPGKRNASVHLLSGGEKAMTAVALIFAIFHLNPSPVCLLDEVDAPLDDANVARFAGLIEEMSADVQFVVITHNKITMEKADYLMGVTMQEPGVSRLVSVDVDEAAAMAVG